MSHSFQIRGTNIAKPQTPIRNRVRRKMDRLECAPRVPVTGGRPPRPV